MIDATCILSSNFTLIVATIMSDQGF